MKKKLLAGIVSILMAVPLLFISSSPASAACTSEVNTKTNYRLVLDDELNGYVKFYASVYFYDCGNTREFRYVRVGYAPDTRYNSSLNCGSSVGKLYRVRMNFGAFLGNNPAAWEANCVSSGNYKTYDWANVLLNDSNTSADRCSGTHWTAVLNNWPDISGDIPQVCF